MPSVPVPTYTISGFDSDTRIAPMEGVWKNPSETFCQLSPALVVFQTPPPDAPMKKVSGWSLTPATAVTRPPRLGPRERKWSSRKRSCGTVSPAKEPRAAAERTRWSSIRSSSVRGGFRGPREAHGSGQVH